MAKNKLSANHKYFSRCQYYGTLEDWEYISDAMVLIFLVYTATEFFGKQQRIRVYVPSELESKLSKELIQGENYFVITAPYRVAFKNEYRHRVDMLLGIFKEVI